MPASKPTTICDLAGNPIKSVFSVESDDNETSVIVASRGGSIGAANETNAQYNLGVDLLLSRLAETGCILNDAVVDTRETTRLGLSREERRLAVEEFPLDLRSANLESLRIALCAAQRPIGRKPGAKGSGNNTKRMRLYVSGLPDSVTAATLLLARHPVSRESDDDLATVVRPLRKGRRQGRGLTAPERRAVELRAMEVVRDYLLTSWSSVDDVSSHESCDFVCRSHNRELFVEVKGTIGGGERVIVTRNEVALARAKSPNSMLALVSSIALSHVSGGVVANGGHLTLVSPWEPKDDDLEPLAFDYRVERGEP